MVGWASERSLNSLGPLEARRRLIACTGSDTKAGTWGGRRLTKARSSDRLFETVMAHAAREHAELSNRPIEHVLRDPGDPCRIS